MVKKIFLVSLGIFMFVGGFAGAFFILNRVPSMAHASTNGNWPMFMGDFSRTGMNASETVITPSTASSLRYSWKFTTGGYVVASPSFVNGVMYEGSWDGYEYAIDVTAQQVLWKQYLGITKQNKYCYASSVGVTSSAAVDNGTVYVGGGDGNIYALNAANGTVLWKTMVGLPPYYNFSSPLVYNGEVYVGLAAFCDPPFVQGKVLALNTADGSILASVSLVSGNQTGATVWSSPALDTATKTLYVTTGNNGSNRIDQQPLAESIVALDATTLAVKDHWQIPVSQQVSDSDFGATPVLFSANGKNYIGALNKNGIYYVLDRDNLSAGPVWEQTMSSNSQTVPGDNVSSSCYNNGMIYAGSAGNVVNGRTYGGTVQAFNAATGSVLWAIDVPGEMVSAVTCVNGLVVDNEGDVVQVRDASNGNVLFRYATMRRLEGASVIYNGGLYTPSTDGAIWVFKPKTVATPTPPPGIILQDNFDSYAPGPLPVSSGSTPWTSVSTSGTGFAVAVSNAESSSSPNSLQFSLGSGAKGHAYAKATYTTGYSVHAVEINLFLDPSLTYSDQALPLLRVEDHRSPLNGSVALWLSVGRSLQVIWYDSTGNKHVFGTGQKLTSGRWYSIEVDQDNSPTNGSWSLWLDKTLLDSETGIDLGSTQVDTLIVGDNVSSVSAMSGVFYEDDIVTSDQHIG